MSENSSVYNELRLEQQLCDAVIRVDDVEFHVHKLLLCNCSTYFRALFTHWSTPDSQVFDIPNVSPDMMRLIIEFAYTGFVHVTQENIQELFIAADRFNVMGILEACSHILEEQLAPQNCIGIWWFTDLYYYPELRRKTFLYILNHFEEVAATSEEFLLLSVQELAKMIENDQLSVKKEKTVFEAILRWITYAPEQRREYISLLLSKSVDKFSLRPWMPCLISEQRGAPALFLFILWLVHACPRQSCWPLEAGVVAVPPMASRRTMSVHSAGSV
uniref:BTB domain-containing protein n=1 Tax=Seriola lalandi dorsalis TaxID=1841481 RepID=A0A3B4X478_SERLL